MADKTELLSDRGRGQDSGQCDDSELGDATLSRAPRRGPGGSRRVSPTVQYIHITDMNVSNTLQRSYVKLVHHGQFVSCNYDKYYHKRTICTLLVFVCKMASQFVYTEFVLLGSAQSKSTTSVTPPLGQNVTVSRVMTLGQTVTKVLTGGKSVTLCASPEGQPRSDLSWPVAWMRSTPATRSPGAL